MENTVCSTFPFARHQFCVDHFKRNALVAVSYKYKLQMSRELNELFEMEDSSCICAHGYDKLTIFTKRWGSRYPSIKRLKHERNAVYFTYLFLV
ncbi:transposase [Hallella colorans]|uniref:transposase n=1 Tax=Hallella colorans TaxID=1703337 RepID=UPI003CD0D9D0